MVYQGLQPAEKAVDIISDRLGKRKIKSRTEYTPICGGNIRCLEDFTKDAMQKCPPGINFDQIRALIQNYGSLFQEVLKYVDENPAWTKTLGTSTTLEAEVIHAVREEMAQKLTDVVFRRTDLCTGGYSDKEALHRSAELAAKELGWNDDRLQQELGEVMQVYPRFSGRDKVIGRK
jgi:glycerol-3-phosphate dehydrogenase